MIRVTSLSFACSGVMSGSAQAPRIRRSLIGSPPRTFFRYVAEIGRAPHLPTEQLIQFREHRTRERACRPRG